MSAIKRKWFTCQQHGGSPRRTGVHRCRCWSNTVQDKTLLIRDKQSCYNWHGFQLLPILICDFYFIYCGRGVGIKNRPHETPDFYWPTRVKIIYRFSGFTVATFVFNHPLNDTVRYKPVKLLRRSFQQPTQALLVSLPRLHAGCEKVRQTSSPARKVGSDPIEAGGSVETQGDIESSLFADVYIGLARSPCVAVLTEARIFINEVHTRASIQTRTGGTVL